VALLAIPAFAGTVYNTSTDVTFTSGVTTGTRTVTPMQINAFGTYGNLRLDWSITDNSNGLFTYQYTFSGLNNTVLRPDISHFILELSQGCTAVNGCVQNATMQVGSNTPVAIGSNQLVYGTFGAGQGNPLFPMQVNGGGVPSIFGVKFDLSTDGSPVTYSFTSNKAPVWGHFYAKGGSENGNNFGVAYNYGLTSTAIASANQSTNWYILRPDTFGEFAEVPEPGTIVLTGAGLLAALLWRRRAQQS
jgi:hypothetical protein